MENITVIVKNIEPENLDIFSTCNATSIQRFGRRRGLLSFTDPQYARFFIQNYHQTSVNGRIISVEYFRKSSTKNQKTDNKSDEMPSISKFVKKLYATCDELQFDQPPPPYLKYSYPSINSDILDSISIALMSNSRFYTQVLHLMNRMNLDPPFGPKKIESKEDGEVTPLRSGCEVGTQTDPMRFSSDEESELESDTEKRPSKSRKRKLPDKEKLYRNKVKKILHVTALTKKQSNQNLNQQKEKNLESVFEGKKPLVSQKIALNVDKAKIPEPTENNVSKNDLVKETFTPPEHLKTNQIPTNQLNDIPVFKNYTKGEPFNKLYIKNLHKDVTETDLRSLYERFYPTLGVNVLQKGRMKGQAFVTFENLEANRMDLVEEALNATNGFILRTKPMVVCYAKKNF